MAVEIRHWSKYLYQDWAKKTRAIASMVQCLAQWESKMMRNYQESLPARQMFKLESSWDREWSTKVTMAATLMPSQIALRV